MEIKPSSLISQDFRLAPTHISALRKLGIATIEDLLRHFPARYDQGGQESDIAGLQPGSEATIFGTISKLDTRKSWKRKIPVGEATISDGSGSIKVMWFHQPYLAKKFSDGMFVKAVGTVGGSSGKLYLANPHVEVADAIESGLFASPEDSRLKTENSFFAVYPESRGVTSLWFRHAIARVLKEGAHEQLRDPIPQETLERYHLPDLATALVWIHTPEKISHAEAARKRFAFEEIFSIQVARALERARNDAQASFPIVDAKGLAKKFLDSLDIKPTHAQLRAIDDILADFSKGHPMARLLEGDVGSGKTLVAAAASYAIVNSRPPKRESGTLQVAYMAPTEILAAQHFQSFIEYFKDLPINIALITGSGCKKFPSKVKKGAATEISRSQLLKWVANGEIAMLVGTHALIQKSVTFQHLAFAIVDEQHRFGTRQRAALAHKNSSKTDSPAARRKGIRPAELASLRQSSSEYLPVAPPLGASPHFLSMTATPIPRTLALTIYGDLDLSVLDELPPGRAAIETKLLKPKERDQAYKKMREELAKGRQAYVICPRIDEPDPAKMNAVMARSAKAEQARLQKDIFPEYEVGLLHGAMTPKEKDAAMRDFDSGTTNILVATSVVEVGINVPNATVILIEGAERFGLAQLHQLRGRIQRSSHKPYCFLLTESSGESAMKRLRALEKSSDGFELAQADLENRGSGDLYGRKQWGVSDLGMEALKNAKLIQAARDEAQGLVSRDPSLSTVPALRERIEHSQRELHGE